jgi:hypothetical protein
MRSSQASNRGAQCRVAFRTRHSEARGQVGSTCERVRRCLDTMKDVCCTALCSWHWVVGEACIPPVDSAGDRPVGASFTPFLTLLSPGRKDECDYGVASAGSVSNRGSSSSVGSAGGSGAPRASRPPGWLAWRNRRLNSRSNLPVFHWPYRQVQSFCKRRKVWQSIYLRSSGARRFINELRTYQCQSDRGFQIRRFHRMDLSPRGFCGMILVGGRAIFNGRIESAFGRTTNNTQREGRTERGGLQYSLFN